MTEEVVDAGRFERLRASLVDDPADRSVPDVLAQIAGRYGRTNGERLAAVRAAQIAGDDVTVVRELHRIRGSNAMLGAVRVERIAGDAEERLHRGEPVGPWLDDVVAELEQACERTGAELARLAGQSPG